MTDPTAPNTLKHKIGRLLEPPPEASWPARLVDLSILVLIVANVSTFVVGTIPAVARGWGEALATFELASVAVFTVEYLARLWTADVTRPGPRARLRYATSPMGIVDLLAILPFYLFRVIDLRVLRGLRLLRLFRSLKLARHSMALQLLGRVLQQRWRELAALMLVVALVFVFAAAAVYHAEARAQPDKFGSIPAAMWWCVVTLTTVGYGDVFPVTLLGKFFAGLTMLFAVGFVALPTGIVGATLTDELMQARKAGTKRTKHTCPQCGACFEAQP